MNEIAQATIAFMRCLNVDDSVELFDYLAALAQAPERLRYEVIAQLETAFWDALAETDYYLCEGCHKIVHADDVVETDDGEFLCSGCANGNGRR